MIGIYGISFSENVIDKSAVNCALLSFWAFARIIARAFFNAVFDPPSGIREIAWFLAALGVLILTSFFLGLRSAPLFDVDEGAFSEATREMMISKNYLTTYLNGAPRFDKPILIYWFQLLSVKLFGINEFAFRLPSALAGTAWATSIFLFVRKESDNRQAFLASAMMVLSLQVVVIAKAAIADGLLNCLLAITMFSLLNHFKTGSKR